MAYRYFTIDQQAALTAEELHVFIVERMAFREEVERLKRHVREHGWLDISAPGQREHRYYIAQRWLRPLLRFFSALFCMQEAV